MLRYLTCLIAIASSRSAGAWARADLTVHALAERLLSLPPFNAPADHHRAEAERQNLMADILVQAVVEAHGPGARDRLKHLLERGAWPGVERLPSLRQLRTQPGLFFFLYVLTQREPEVAELAFDVLKTRGPSFHDDRPFAEIYADFVAQCARVPEHFGPALDVIERLADLAPDVRAVPLAEALSSETSNPFLIDPATRAELVRELMNQIRARRGRVQGELLGALAAIDQPPVTEEITRLALRDPPDAGGVIAVLQGLNRGPVKPEIWRVIARNLPRYAAFAPADGERTLTLAARTLLRPFVKNDPAAVALADLLPQLIASEFAPVRRLAARAIHWPGLSDDQARAMHERLLHDPQEIVRRAAVEEALPARCDDRLRF